MATFISLIDYTEQGLRNIKESPKRAGAFIEAARAAGASVKGLYWTIGGHDGVLILEAPDDQTAASILLTLGRAGNVRTQTLRAFDRPEMESILARTD